MYCPECGTKGSGKFCTNCGTRLSTAEPGGPAVAGEAGTNPSPPADWSRETRYSVLIAHPEVHDLLSRAAARAGQRVPIEKIYEIYDKLMSKSLCGISSAALTPLAAAFWTRLGIKTGKERSEPIDVPIGRAIVAVLCSLAARGYPIKDVHQADDGCAVEAKMPPGLFTYDGTVFVTISADGDRSRVDARTTINGQKFDWGKSTRCLEEIFADVRGFPRS